MKYVSIDIETTGLNPETCQVLEFGAIVEDTTVKKPLKDLPRFHAYIMSENGLYVGEPYALALNVEIIKKLSDPSRHNNDSFIVGSELGQAFDEFLQKEKVFSTDPRAKKQITVAGKNFPSFDKPFLEKLPNWKDWVKISHRFIDPAMLYWNSIVDNEIPSTKACMNRAGISGEVAHTALEDAEVVIKLIRHLSVG